MQVIIILIHLMVALVCAVECATALRDLRGQLPRMLVFLSLGIVHGIVPAITPAELQLAAFSMSSRVQAAGLALVGVILFSAGWRLYEFFKPSLLGVSPRLMAVVEGPHGQTLLRRLFVTCAVLGLVSWAVSVMATGLSLKDAFQLGRFAEGRSEEFYFAAIARYFIVLSLLPGFLGFFLPRHYRLAGIAYALGMALFLFFASQGSRANPMGLLGALVLGFAMRHRIAWGRAILVGCCGGMILLLSVSLYDVRKSMSRTTLGEMAAMIVSPSTYQGALMRDPLDYHEFLVAAVEYFPDRHPFLNGATYRRMLVFYLPRRYFEALKPEDPNMIFASIVEPESARELTTIPPTMMGDGYINFWGWPGILIMFVNGIVFGMVHWKMRTSVLWFVAIAPLFVRLGVMGIRGQPYEILLLGVWSLTFVWFLGRAFGFSYRDAVTFPHRDSVGFGSQNRGGRWVVTVGRRSALGNE